MPELPEVENVRRGLAGRVVGKTVVKVELRRPNMVHGSHRPADLLQMRTITHIERLGKQLCLHSDGPCVCVHLGMTGSLRAHPPDQTIEPDKHTHLIWHLSDGGSLTFRDPRRFGGVWTFKSYDRLLDERWSLLGEDALTITPARLHAVLQRTGRPIKAALLDQAVLAGLGNIYADELLHACGVSPLRSANRIDRAQVTRLVGCMRRLLNRAVKAGGSTLRDYVGSDGRSGGFQLQHKVYGRADQPCRSCGAPLVGIRMLGRATVYCQACQD